MTKIATAMPHNHHKASQHHHHDEETTAYSSWHDDEDGNSQLSSCLSSVDLHEANHVTACIGEEDDADFHRVGSVILLSSSECSLLNNNGDDDYHSTIENVNKSQSLTSYKESSQNNMEEEEKSNSRMAAFQELSERASLLQKRESSPEYAVEDYFQRSYYEKISTRSCDTNDEEAYKPATDQSISEIEYLTLSPAAVSRRNSTPIDIECRSIMIEWSFRVTEFSFPPPASAQQQEQQTPDDSSTIQNASNKRTTRQHSIEALQLISTTFSYIDRLCTKFKVVDREEYKLLSMVCLNLAAKSSGLFGRDNEKEWYDYFFNHHRSDPCSEHTGAISPSSSSCDNIDFVVSKESVHTGQTILSTPYHDNVVMPRQPQRPRPPMDLISLLGLHSLCNGVFTIEQFFEMEYNVLHRGLDWRLNSVQAIDWVDLSLELVSLLQLEGSGCLTKEDCHDKIRETVLVQLEYAVEISSFVGYAPSLVAIAAFLNAVERYSYDGNCILDCIEEVFGLGFDKSEMAKVRYMMRSQVKEDEYTGILEDDTCKRTR